MCVRSCAHAAGSWRWCWQPGLFNGIVVQTEEGRAAVRSTVEPVEQLVEGGEVDETDETTVEREVYRTRPQVTITLLNEQGEVTDMSGDAALVDFIGRHKTALLGYLDRALLASVQLRLRRTRAYPQPRADQGQPAVRDAETCRRRRPTRRCSSAKG